MRPLFNNYSSPTQDLLAKVRKTGINIYALIKRVENQAHIKNGLPEEVVQGVCKRYLVTNFQGSVWPWLIKTIILETHKYNADKHIQEHKKYKDMDMALSIKDVLRSL